MTDHGQAINVESAEQKLDQVGSRLNEERKKLEEKKIPTADLRWDILASDMSIFYRTWAKRYNATRTFYTHTINSTPETLGYPLPVTCLLAQIHHSFNTAAHTTHLLA